MILLSHGNSGTIYAYDAPYPTQKLWEPFTADRAPSLAGKPKFFFMQVKKYFLTFPACFLLPINFSNLNSNCSNLLDK